MTPQYEKRREYYRQRYKNNRLRLLEQTKKYQEAHPEVGKRAVRKYQEKNAELLREKRRKAYRANVQREAASHRGWVLKNKNARTFYMRSWRALNFARRKEYDTAYRLNHLAEKAERQNARRARQIGNGGSHTKDQWETLKAAYGFRCGYCQEDEVRLTKDHAIPLARGGSDDISNIIPACLPCNRRKHVKTAEEFMVLMSTNWRK